MTKPWASWIARPGKRKNAHAVPSMPTLSYFASGAGTSFTWIEPERRMVLVVRWIGGDYADAFFGRVLEALDDPG